MPVGEPDPLRRAVMRRTLSLVSSSSTPAYAFLCGLAVGSSFDGRARWCSLSVVACVSSSHVEGRQPCWWCLAWRARWVALKDDSCSD